MLRNMDSSILAIELEFLLRREIVPLGVSEGTLTLGMRDVGDVDAIAAMRFATRLEIAPVPIGEHEWAGWRQALTAALAPRYRWATRLRRQRRGSGARRIAASADRRNATIFLGERSVHVRADDYIAAFDADDRRAWSRLAAHIGAGSSVRVLLLAEAVWQIKLSPVAYGEMELEHELARKCPLPIERLTWASRADNEPGMDVLLGVVHKSWLRQRAATIERRLSPTSLTISDEQGRRFAIPKPTVEATWQTATAAAMMVACLVVLMAQVRNPSNAAGVRRASAAAEIPREGPTKTPLPIPTTAIDQASQFELVGVVGRLPRDGVALVRPAWGKTVILRIGDSLLGWRLASITADRVRLVRGAEFRDIVLKPDPRAGG